jgi:peptidoglycan/xylan/chitin deacetylase (PgdA/CDA1 family)
MNLHESQARRAAERRRRIARRRAAVLGALLVVVLAIVAVLAAESGSTPRRAAAGSSRHELRAARRPAPSGAGARRRSGSTVTGRPTGRPGSAHVPILMYHVIAPPPTGAPFPGLYVPADEFAAQMQALKAAGWHPVTLDQLRAYWLHGVPLGPGKPIVLTFDNGYHSQYAAALPVLRRLGWVADENMQLSGLPPSQGGLTSAEVRALVDAGWELDTQGISHADLPALDAAELTAQVASSRHTLQREYHVPVNWFCYPSGQYDARVIAAVKAAGYVGSTTVVPGWATPAEDPYALPRLRVLGGTSPSALLAQIATAEAAGAPPSSYVTGTSSG